MVIHSWLYLLFCGISILLFTGLVYGVIRMFRGRSAISPHFTGALPTPREALREPDLPEGQRDSPSDASRKELRHDQ